MDTLMVSVYLWSEGMCDTLWWLLTFICCLAVIQRSQAEFQDIQIRLSSPLRSPKWKLHPSQDLENVRPLPVIVDSSSAARNLFLRKNPV